jgi:hypothetical protein
MDDSDGIECGLVDLGEDINRIGEIMRDYFVPLFNVFWEKRGREYYEQEKWNVQLAQGMVQMIRDGSLVLVMAEDKYRKNSLGFILGGVLRPMMCDYRSLVVECYYGVTPTVEEKMFEYLGEGLKFMMIKSLIIPAYDGPPLEAFGKIMRERPNRVFLVRGS